MTKEEAVKKAEDLSVSMSKKVHAIVFQESEEGEEIIGFIKEPSRALKLAVLDKAVQGMTSAAAQMLDSVLIKEESDPRIYSERSEDDKIYLGAVMAAMELVKVSQNTLKKK